MNFLEKRIIKDGKVIGEDILKVDSFLNQQVDPILMNKIGSKFSNYFKDKNITKIITVESSGISPALITSLKLKVPMVILKKSMSKTLNNDIYTTKVKSFTKGNTYDLVVSKDYIKDSDNILIIDDFLATGEAMLGVIRLISNTRAKISGIGIVIEKSFQEGRNILEKLGYDVYSIARIKSLKEGKISFTK